jgi:tetratricopeptide (TPR) repeat protein
MEADPKLISLGTVEKEKARWLVSRGDQYAQAGRTDDAIIDFRESIKLDPDIVDAYLYLAMCCVIKKHDMDMVIAILKKGLAVPFPKSEVPLARINICFQLGQHYLKEKNAENARKYLEMGMKLIKNFNSDKESIKTIEQIKKKMHMKTDVVAEINALGVKIYVLLQMVDKGDFSAW